MANSSIYKEALQILEERRLYAKGLQKKRFDEVTEKIPQILEIREQISNTGINIAKSLAKGGDKQELISELKEVNLSLQEQEMYLLEINGFGNNYLKNIYKCNKCEDKGFIENKKCSCLSQIMIDIAYEMSNISKDIAFENFENFDLRFFSDSQKIDGITPKEKMMQNYMIAQRFVTEFDTNFQNLYMYGEVGRGKSFLCNCIAKDILDSSHTVVSMSATDLFKILEEHRFHRDDSNHEDLINYIKTCDLLIIDDLGTEVHSVVTSSELFNIINKRQAEKRHTIISTNLAPNELENIYSHRLESRFLGNFETMKFIGEDIRLMKKFNL